MGSEICDRILCIDGRLVGAELFQDRPDFVIVFEPVAVEKVEDDCRVERGAFVGIDEGMIGDEKSEEVKCFLVDRLWCRIEAPLFDIVQRELDVPTVLYTAGSIWIL